MFQAGVQRGNASALMCSYNKLNGVPACANRQPLFFFNASEHADGERRGPVSLRRCLKTRLAETSPTRPSDPIQPLGVRRRHAPKSC